MNNSVDMSIEGSQSDKIKILNDLNIKVNDEKLELNVQNDQTSANSVLNVVEAVNENQQVDQVKNEQLENKLDQPNQSSENTQTNTDKENMSSLNSQEIVVNQNDKQSNDNQKNNSPIKSQNEVEMSYDESSLHIKPLNLTSKSVDMSVDESLILNDIRNIFETSTTSSAEFIISKPLKKIKMTETKTIKEAEMDMSCSDNNDSLILRDIKIGTNDTLEDSLNLKLLPSSKVFKLPKSKLTKENDMDMSCCSDNNDSLILKDVKIENNEGQEESPYLKSLPPPKMFKLSRKRLNSELESPIKKATASTNLFKNKFQPTQQQNTPITNLNKKWRSATYNPMTSSPKKMEISSPLKEIDNNRINNQPVAFASPFNNLLISNLNMMIQKSDQVANLMGDYSSTYALPLMTGRHKDLKTITPETLAKLMNGDYSKSIGCFTIIDSRYPYEYEGGHIDGSKNIYHKDDINKYFFGTDKPTLVTSKTLIKSTIDKNLNESSTFSMQRDLETKNSKLNCNKRLSVVKEGENDENQVVVASKDENDVSKDSADSAKKEPQIKRHAIIFHCEFSSERGPSMCRYLRKIDRELNESCYPNLYYPEIYLLHGGYKLFYEKFKGLCYPQTYLPMHSSDHKQDLIKFRKKSKTWNCDGSKSVAKWKSIAK